MSSITDPEKLRILLSHWVNHNGEHAQEYKEWAERAGNFGSKEAGLKINAAIEEMSAVNNHLLDALELLGGHLKHNHEDHDHSHHHHGDHDHSHHH
jgi:hypothetical protein